MSKKDKKPLSKAVGEWDNGFSDNAVIDYTYQQVRNAFLANDKYNKMLKKNQLQLVLRGSFSKNSANYDSDDLDIHCNFNIDVDLREEKAEVEETLKNYFGKDYVRRHYRSLVIFPNKKRLKVDLVVCRQKQGYIEVWNDHSKKKEVFYPTKDERALGQRNDATEGRFLNMVRAFKTVRNCVCEINKGKYHITSHAIECMLFWVKPKIYKKIRDKDAEQDARELFIAIEQSVGSRLKNIKELDKAKEVNGEKQLFSFEREYGIVCEFWADQHKWLSQNYDFEK